MSQQEQHANQNSRGQNYSNIGLQQESQKQQTQIGRRRQALARGGASPLKIITNEESSQHDMQQIMAAASLANLQGQHQHFMNSSPISENSPAQRSPGPIGSQLPKKYLVDTSPLVTNSTVLQEQSMMQMSRQEGNDQARTPHVSLFQRQPPRQDSHGLIIPGVDQQILNFNGSQFDESSISLAATDRNSRQMSYHFGKGAQFHFGGSKKELIIKQAHHHWQSAKGQAMFKPNLLINQAGGNMQGMHPFVIGGDLNGIDRNTNFTMAVSGSEATAAQLLYEMRDPGSKLIMNNGQLMLNPLDDIGTGFTHMVCQSVQVDFESQKEQQTILPIVKVAEENKTNMSLSLPVIKAYPLIRLVQYLLLAMMLVELMTRIYFENGHSSSISGKIEQDFRHHHHSSALTMNETEYVEAFTIGPAIVMEEEEVDDPIKQPPPLNNIQISHTLQSAAHSHSLGVHQGTSWPFKLYMQTSGSLAFLILKILAHYLIGLRYIKRVFELIGQLPLPLTQLVEQSISDGNELIGNMGDGHQKQKLNHPSTAPTICQTCGQSNFKTTMGSHMTHANEIQGSSFMMDQKLGTAGGYTEQKLFQIASSQRGPYQESLGSPTLFQEENQKQNSIRKNPPLASGDSSQKIGVFSSKVNKNEQDLTDNRQETSKNRNRGIGGGTQNEHQNPLKLKQGGGFDSLTSSISPKINFHLSDEEDEVEEEKKYDDNLQGASHQFKLRLKQTEVATPSQSNSQNKKSMGTTTNSGAITAGQQYTGEYKISEGQICDTEKLLSSGNLQAQNSQDSPKNPISSGGAVATPTDILADSKPFELNRSRSTNEIKQENAAQDCLNQNCEEQLAARSSTLLSIERSNSRLGNGSTAGRNQHRRGLNYRQESKSKFYHQASAAAQQRRRSITHQAVRDPRFQLNNLNNILQTQPQQLVVDAATSAQSSEYDINGNDAGVTSVDSQQRSVATKSNRPNKGIKQSDPALAEVAAPPAPGNNSPPFNLNTPINLNQQQLYTISSVGTASNQIGSSTINNGHQLNMNSLTKSEIVNFAAAQQKAGGIGGEASISDFGSVTYLSNNTAAKFQGGNQSLLMQSVNMLNNKMNGLALPPHSHSQNTSLPQQSSQNSAKPNQDKLVIEMLKQKVRKLQKQLINNKIFLNMVIHDMRNPTNSIEFAVKEVIRLMALVNNNSIIKKNSLSGGNQGSQDLREQKSENLNSGRFLGAQGSNQYIVKSPNFRLQPLADEQEILYPNSSTLEDAKVFSKEESKKGPLATEPSGFKIEVEDLELDKTKQCPQSPQFPLGQEEEVKVADNSIESMKSPAFRKEQQNEGKLSTPQRSESKMLKSSVDFDEEAHEAGAEFHNVSNEVEAAVMKYALDQSELQPEVPDEDSQDHTVPYMKIQERINQFANSFQVTHDISHPGQVSAVVNHDMTIGNNNAQIFSASITPFNLPCTEKDIDLGEGVGHKQHLTLQDVNSINQQRNSLFNRAPRSPNEGKAQVMSNARSLVSRFIQSQNRDHEDLMSQHLVSHNKYEGHKSAGHFSQLAAEEIASMKQHSQARESTQNKFQPLLVDLKKSLQSRNKGGTPQLRKEPTFGFSPALGMSFARKATFLQKPPEDGTFDPNLYNVQQSLFLEIEYILQQYQDSGIVINDEKRTEIETLLKNSVFSSTMLLNLINDLLDLAKMENSSFKLNWTYFDLFEVVEKTAETLDSQLGLRKIRVTHTFSKKDRAFFKSIYGDQHRYLQILLNFMSNAVKFTPENGTITVHTVLIAKQLAANNNNTSSNTNQGAFGMAATSNQNILVNATSGRSRKNERRGTVMGMGLTNQGGGTMKNQNSNLQGMTGAVAHASSDTHAVHYVDFEIRIVDSGCGISKENLDKLFMNFSRLDEHSAMNQRGTGLGLSICKSLLELMGGSVTVESELGKGTTFIIKLRTWCRVRRHPLFGNAQTGGGGEGDKSQRSNSVTNPTSSSIDAVRSSFLNGLRAGDSGANEISIQPSSSQGVNMAITRSHTPPMNPPRFGGLVLKPTPPIDNQSPQLGASDRQKQLGMMEQVVEEEEKIMSPFGDGNSLVIPAGVIAPKQRKLTEQQCFIDMDESQLNELLMQRAIEKKKLAEKLGCKNYAESNDKDSFDDTPSRKPQNITHQRRASMMTFLKQMRTFRDQKKGDYANIPSNGVLAPSGTEDSVGMRMGSLSVARQLMHQSPESSSGLLRPFGSKNLLGTPKARPEQTRKLYKVLVANDDCFQLKIIERVLITQGDLFHIEEAENGLVAVDKFNQRSASGMGFDLIILDLDMPIMSGYEACKKIRGTDNTTGIKDILLIDQKFLPRHPGQSKFAHKHAAQNAALMQGLSPVMNGSSFFGQDAPSPCGQNKGGSLPPLIIALSALVEESTRVKCLDCGFDDVIECPLTQTKVSETIMPMLHKRESSSHQLDQMINNLVDSPDNINPNCQLEDSQNFATGEEDLLIFK